MATRAQLRRAAERIAHRLHPDQTGSAHPSAFSLKSDRFATVRMSGGDVLVTREAAEAEVQLQAKAQGWTVTEDYGQPS